MKKHIKKFVVFIINAAIVLGGVFIIKSYEKNKSNSETNMLSDSQAQNLETNPAAIGNDAANQAESSVSNAIDNSNLPSPPAVSSPTSAKTVAPAPNASSVPAAKTSTPKTKTS